MSDKKIGRPKKRGRPRKDPNYIKEKIIMLRLDMNDEMTLYNLSRWLERPQADVLRLALRNLELDYIQGKTKKVYDDCHIGS